MIEPDDAVPPPVEEAVSAARAGLVIVLPTDTVYGLACRPDDGRATARLFSVKHRARGLSLPVLAGSSSDARRAAVFDGRADLVAGRVWPGPVTLVLPRTEESMSWDLGEDPETIAVRIPGHRLARSVLLRTGPLAATSANRSGERPGTTCAELEAMFGDAVAVTLCEERPIVGRPSAVLDLTGSDPRLLRAGPLSREDLDELLLAGEPGDHC